MPPRARVASIQALPRRQSSSKGTSSPTPSTVAATKLRTNSVPMVGMAEYRSSYCWRCTAPTARSESAPSTRAVNHTQCRTVMPQLPASRGAGITPVTNVARCDLADHVPRIPYVWRVTDEALLAGFAVGDAGAAETFISRFQRRVYGVALAITRDARLAEDLAQEAFVRAWRHAETFDPRRGSVATWLIVIARNLAVDAMRTQPRSEFVDPEELEWLALPAAGADPAETALRTSDADWLRQALDEVPDEQRRAVVLAGDR